jgi:hypothetical protein
MNWSEWNKMEKGATIRYTLESSVKEGEFDTIGLTSYLHQFPDRVTIVTLYASRQDVRH